MNRLTRVRHRARLQGRSREEQLCLFIELDKAIAELPRRLQQIAWMVSEGWTEREMATVLGISPATANRLKNRVLKLLAENFGDDEAKTQDLVQMKVEGLFQSHGS